MFAYVWIGLSRSTIQRGISQYACDEIFNIQYSIPKIKGLLTHEDSYAIALYLNIENSVLIIVKIVHLLIEKIFNVQCSIHSIKGSLTPEDSYATALYLKIENSVLIIDH